MKPATEAIIRAGARWRDPDCAERKQAVERTLEASNRFTEPALAFAINQQMALLKPDNVHAWVRGRTAKTTRTVGVLNAGNIPLVGLQDWLAVILTGHRYLGTVSSKSPALLPAFVTTVTRLDPSISSRFVPASELWEEIDTVIATGSNETSAWCEQQADQADIPRSRRLLRGHRYSVAILDGQENANDCSGLAEDVLLHEGAGCRNIAMVFAPAALSPDRILEHFAQFRAVFPPHASTPGALAVARAFLKAIDAPHAYGDGLAFLVSRGTAEVQGPGHLRWVPYDDSKEAARYIASHKDEIQCVATRQGLCIDLPGNISQVELGNTQRPDLAWCPDGKDTLDFLTQMD